MIKNNNGVTLYVHVPLTIEAISEIARSNYDDVYFHDNIFDPVLLKELTCRMDKFTCVYNLNTDQHYVLFKRFKFSCKINMKEETINIVYDNHSANNHFLEIVLANPVDNEVLDKLFGFLNGRSFLKITIYSDDETYDPSQMLKLFELITIQQNCVLYLRGKMDLTADARFNQFYQVILDIDDIKDWFWKGQMKTNKCTIFIYKNRKMIVGNLCHITNV